MTFCIREEVAGLGRHGSPSRSAVAAWSSLREFSGNSILAVTGAVVGFLLPARRDDVGQFANHPDYRLRWPADVFEAELATLIGEGHRDGTSIEWRDSVELLLRQAFGSDVPIEQFRKEYDKPPPAPLAYDYDEEPF